jgi:hypothetical protein
MEDNLKRNRRQPKKNRKNPMEDDLKKTLPIIFLFKYNRITSYGTPVCWSVFRRKKGFVIIPLVLDTACCAGYIPAKTIRFKGGGVTHNNRQNKKNTIC